MSFLSLFERTFVLLAVFQFTCFAQTIDPVFEPPGLELGDEYRLIFVTSSTRDATATDIEDYNVFVQSVADAAPAVGSWGLEWKALASTATVDAVDNTSTDLSDDPLPIYRIDGEPFARAGVHPFGGSGSPSVFAVEFTELGTKPPSFEMDGFRGAAVWTGTGLDGRAGQPFGPLGGGSRGNATLGDSAQGSFAAYANGSAPASMNAHFYAISEVISVVPEPDISPLSLLFYSSVVLSFWGHRIRAGD